MIFSEAGQTTGEFEEGGCGRVVVATFPDQSELSPTRQPSVLPPPPTTLYTMWACS